MRRVLAIVWKDLRSIYRQPSAVALMIAVPLALASLLGLAFGGQSGFHLDPVKIAVVNLDKTGGGAPALSAASVLAGVLTGPQTASLLDARMVATADRARRLVDDGEATVAVIVPEGFSAAARSVRGSAAVEIYRDPASQIGAGVATGVVESMVRTLDDARRAATVAAEVVREARPAVDDPARLAEAAAATAAASLAASARGATVALDERAPRLSGAAASEDPGVAGQVLAGQMVLFLFFGAANAARTILLEEQEGTLARLFTTPGRRAGVLGGKLLVSFVTVLVQSCVLLLAGWLLFGIAWGGPASVVLLTIVGCLVASGLAMVIGSLARTLAQQGAIGSGIFLLLALIGGNFIGGGATLGGVAGVLRRITPNGWILEGWDAAMRGGGVADVLLPVLVALGFAAVFFAAAAVVLRRRFA